MKKISLLISFLIAITYCSAQTLLWQKSYGGTNHEYCWKTIPTSDGGYAFVGDCESNDNDVTGNHGGVDLWVAKTNSLGVLQWSYLFGGTEDEFGKDIIQTTDGGFMVAGYTYSTDGDVTGHHGTYNNDYWILKLTSTGTLSWSKCFGGTYDDEVSSMVQNASGDYYVMGSTYSNDGDVSGNHLSGYTDFWVMKMSSTGTLLAQKCIGGSEYEEGINLTLTADNGCIVGGRTASNDGDAVGYHSGNDMLIAKLNSSLVVEWSKCYGGSGTEECNSIVQLSDGSYAALGYTSTQNNGDVTGHHGSQGSDDFWLLKLTSTGAITWAKCFGGDGDDQANALTKTADGGFVMSGLTNSTNGDVSGFHNGGFFEPDIWVCKVNAAGIFQWQRCCGGSGQDESFNVFEEGSGTFVITGFTYSGDYDVTLNRGSADGWIIKVTGTIGISEVSDDVSFSVYPNPAVESILLLSNLSGKQLVQVIDLSGKKIIEQNISVISSEPAVINVSELKPGKYFIRIGSNNKVSGAFFIKD